MKKLLCLFGASLLVLTSCSNDDDNNAATSTLVKEITHISTNGASEVVKISYAGNKIVQAVTGENKTVYTYTGDVITKVVELDEKNEVDDVIEYTYANGKVASFVESEPGAPSRYKTTYTHNADGSVSYKVVSIDNTTNKEEENSTGVLTIKAGNVTKDVRTSGSGYVYSTTYEYDAKNNPTKNILGFNLLLDNEQSVSVNNVLKSTEVSSYSGGSSTYVYASTYTYDANGFPTEEKSFDKDGKLSRTIKYAY